MPRAGGSRSYPVGQAEQRKASHQQGSPYPKLPARCWQGHHSILLSITLHPKDLLVLPGARTSLCTFLPLGPAPGTGSLWPSGAARRDPPASPKVSGNQTKRAEKKGKARRGVERRGRCQQAASSHLLPARGLQGPPALRLTGTTLALGVGGRHTPRGNIPHLSAAALKSFRGGCWPSLRGARGLPGCLRRS